MFVPELLCRSIHTSNNGALTATRQHKTGLLTATLNKKTSQQPCLQMAEHTYPSEVAVAAYISGDATAVSRRVAFVAEHFPGRTREFSWDAVREVGQHFCAQRLYSKTTSWIKRSWVKEMLRCGHLKRAATLGYPRTAPLRSRRWRGNG